MDKSERSDCVTNLLHSAVVIGGGSWGQVIVSELACFEPSLKEVHWISRHRFEQACQTDGRARTELGFGSSSTKIRLWPSLPEFLANNSADVGFVANTPSKHCTAAEPL